MVSIPDKELSRFIVESVEKFRPLYIQILSEYKFADVKTMGNPAMELTEDGFHKRVVIDFPILRLLKN